ncbi:proline-rich receptor-like protein kinase PERK2 [Iris pallida]|uniref:Proline-rich receptor-like protein kinase PERK2 n=1 Tax=Iris pallida TaxID=29817 RepID=A0AAX6FFT5_IRIPA|nr:proline-rich receptor-like protein kinase PERK2 [Iris pallida]KAJ6836256.1 proline-rich receptor-like protein kinase PERK2 [Iris pallida]
MPDRSGRGWLIDREGWPMLELSFPRSIEVRRSEEDGSTLSTALRPGSVMEVCGRGGLVGLDTTGYGSCCKIWPGGTTAVVVAPGARAARCRSGGQASVGVQGWTSRCLCAEDARDFNNCVIAVRTGEGGFFLVVLFCVVAIWAVWR